MNRMDIEFQIESEKWIFHNIVKVDFAQNGYKVLHRNIAYSIEKVFCMEAHGAYSTEIVVSIEAQYTVYKQYLSQKQEYSVIFSTELF